MKTRRDAPRFVDVDRLDLPPPGVAGSFALAEYLRDDVKAGFEEPDRLLQESADRGAGANRRRRARHYVRDRDNVAHLSALDTAGMLDFEFEPEVCDEDTAGGFASRHTASTTPRSGFGAAAGCRSAERSLPTGKARTGGSAAAGYYAQLPEDTHSDWSAGISRGKLKGVMTDVGP